MEKIFKDEGINMRFRSRGIILSGNTDRFRAEFTNLGGRELRSGNWSFEKDMENALVEVVLNSERKDIRLNAENMSTPEVLAICKSENLALDTDNRDDCVQGAVESKPYIDPDEISLQIRKELEKVLDLKRADPKIIYDVVASYFGRGIAPLYKTYLPLYQEELEKLKNFLDVPEIELAFFHTYEDEELLGLCSNLGLTFEGGDIESCKVALLSNESPLGRELRENIQTILSRYDENDVSIPTVMEELNEIYGRDFVKGTKSFLVDVIDEEIQIFAEESPLKVAGLILPEPKKMKKIVKAKGKPKSRKPKDPLKLNKATRKLFDDIRDGILVKALDEQQQGQSKFYGSVSDLLKKQETEDEKTYNIRRLITEKIERAGLEDLSPDKIVLLGYLFTKKMMYGVVYDNYVEIELQDVRNRM